MMAPDRNPIYRELGVREVINGRSYSTKMGGSIMDPEVVEAMRPASQAFVRIENLEQVASKTIAEVTGGEREKHWSGAWMSPHSLSPSGAVFSFELSSSTC